MMMTIRKIIPAFLLILGLVGCVNQHPESQKNKEYTSVQKVSTMIEISDPKEKAAVEQAKAKALAQGKNLKIIATSPAVADICDRLEIDLVGVCSSSVSTIPKRYKGLPTIGTAMSPDMEKVAALQPNWILSPSSLQSDLQSKYENLKTTEWAFLNLKSVQGMYRSIQELGEIFSREKQAQKLVDEFTTFYEDYQKKHHDKEKPKVLILMGMPGSYVIATENSYVGSLVALAGGENVYSHSSEEFLTVNTEDMKSKEPDVILRAVHALPDQVVEMFKEDFETNTIWKHFKAVKENRVYDLDYKIFGMSASFEYPKALEELQTMLYPKE